MKPPGKHYQTEGVGALKKRFGLASLSLLLSFGLTTCALGQGIYWTQGTYGSSKLRRATSGGAILNDVTAANSSISLPQGVAIDTVSGKLFWVSGGYTRANVYQSGPDLSTTDSLAGNASTFRGIALDVKDGKMYWTSTNLILGPKIYRANLDGSGQTVLIDFYALHDSLTTPRGIAVDTVDQKIYWASDATGKIMRSNFDGSTIETVESRLTNPTGIALDMPLSKIYWTECDNPGGKVRRSDLTNSGATLANITDLATNLASPYAIALDAMYGKLYWTELGGSTTNPRIVESNSDGSSSTVVVDNIADPYGIAVDISVDPLLTVSSASDVTTSSATLSGTVIPNGSSTYASFQYGTSAAYGTTTATDTLDDPETALSFNGTSTYVNAGTSSLFNFTGSFTIEGWFKASAFSSGWEAIVTKGDASWRVQRYNATDNLDFGTNGLSNQDLQGTTNVNDGNWHHVAAVYDGSNKFLYVDGKLDAEAAVSGTLSTDTDPLYFGENAQMTGRYFDGLIDEVRIWNAALDSATIRTWMCREVTQSHPYYSSLAGYWQFNEGTGSVAYDSSGNANNGTLVNSPAWTDGARAFSVSADISGLAASTMYHYRLQAANAVGSPMTSDSTFTTAAPLAVELASMKASSDIDRVTLSWQTATEVDNAGFNVLRKNPIASAFTVIASFKNDTRLRGAGTSSTPKSYNFADNAVISGTTYSYKLQTVSTTGAVKDGIAITVTVGVPKDYALYQNYPNPFNPSTTIRFDLKQTSSVRLEVYNILGQRVYDENKGVMGSGRFNETFDMSRFASGVYIYRIAAVGSNDEKFVSMKKMMLIK
jgi:hypothetical protein